MATQTTFCEAQALAANEQLYLQKIEKIQQEKAQLKSISEDKFDTQTGRSVWHFGVSGVVDIPLFNLHVRERK